MRERRRLAPRSWAVLAVLLVFVGASVLPEAQTTPSIRIVGVHLAFAGGSRILTLDLGLQGGSQTRDLQGLLFQTANVTPVRDIAFYFDTAYPIVGDPGRVYGVLDHLTPALRDRGYAGNLRVVDASGLVSILSSSDTPVVIMATTVIPISVLAPTTNLLTPWLARGGILIWTGGLIGGYTAGPGQTDVQWGDFGNLAWRGEQTIFGTSVVGSAAAFPGAASTPTSVATWLGLRYPLAYVGAKMGSLQSLGGFAMGYLLSGPSVASTISWIPVGEGGVVLFGYGPIMPQGYSAEDVVAGDIAQILLSGLLKWDRSTFPSSVAVHVAGSATESTEVSLTLTPAARFARLYLFSTGPLPPIGYGQDVDAVNGTLLPL